MYKYLLSGVIDASKHNNHWYRRAHDILQLMVLQHNVTHNISLISTCFIPVAHFILFRRILDSELCLSTWITATKGTGKNVFGFYSKFTNAEYGLVLDWIDAQPTDSYTDISILSWGKPYRSEKPDVARQLRTTETVYWTKITPTEDSIPILLNREVKRVNSEAVIFPGTNDYLLVNNEVLNTVVEIHIW